MFMIISTFLQRLEDFCKISLFFTSLRRQWVSRIVFFFFFSVSNLKNKFKKGISDHAKDVDLFNQIRMQNRNYNAKFLTKPKAKKLVSLLSFCIARFQQFLEMISSLAQALSDLSRIALSCFSKICS